MKLKKASCRPVRANMYLQTKRRNNMTDPPARRSRLAGVFSIEFSIRICSLSLIKEDAWRIFLLNIRIPPRRAWQRTDTRIRKSLGCLDSEEAGSENPLLVVVVPYLPLEGFNASRDRRLQRIDQRI